MIDTYDVVICGAGPTGVLLAAYLSRGGGVKVLIVEKTKAITTDPRGICVDDETIRMIQGLGLNHKVYSEIGFTPTCFYFHPGDHDLYSPPVFKGNCEAEAGHAHKGSLFHEQPMLEKNVRCVFENDPNITLKQGVELVGISEDAESVTITYKNEEGKEHQSKGKFLVGADGKVGYVRKNFLEAKGVRQLDSEKLPYVQWWVAINWKLDLPTPETHPNFPLWKLGYTPQQVFDEFFPFDFRFICNIKRPSICGRFGIPSKRLWRFEYIINEGEDPWEMAEPQVVRDIIYPYITHKGSRYGLKEDVMYPEDCITVLRARPFKFKAQVANKWVVGRTMVAGDAAHNFPPFGGQGIASGFRDSIALAWRLALIAKYPNVNYEELLTGWYVERKQQVEVSLAITVLNGNLVCERSYFWSTVRNVIARSLALIPPVRKNLEMGHRGVMMRYKYLPHSCFLPDREGGVFLPQIHLWQNNLHAFSDDVIFAKRKTGIFQIVVLTDTVQEARIREAEIASAELEQLSNGLINTSETTYIVHKEKSSGTVPKNFVFAMSFSEYDEMGITPQLTGYTKDRIQQEFPWKKFVVVRPDRYTFGTAIAADGVQDIARRASSLIFGEKGSQK